ncbi:MAG: N-6 DNA methylase [Planctomycetaceae bacterium]|nr:N-6 DNA methylase [Planctomycetaceae bacterium]
MDIDSGKINLLRRLIELFSSNIVQYKDSAYGESKTRTDFIDKFFMLLDWDISNESGYSESYRDVVREDKVKIDGRQKVPDYCFRIGGVRKFFVEAKKPSVNIKESSESAYQLRRYAYTAKLPLSILTDFEEFAIYDTRIKPNKNDKASVARIFYCTYQDYEKQFDFIYNTFSKTAIQKGSFDKYIEENKNKKGTSEVDNELLHLVEEWRVDLAKNIALRNHDISIHNLNTIVQKIIDRIVFLRIAEDKGIEDFNVLKNIAAEQNVYKKLNQLFIGANDKYNSGLFRRENWIEEVMIDDKVLSVIITNLYYPDCPYEFSVLPVEILGNIYEKFLGKTIYFKNVKGGHTAIIESKPEVRKAGGVFYTPQYIVAFVVKNTVGRKIEGKTPDEISHCRIVDPACGSGSMLAGAYQFILDYHLDYYTSDKNIKSAVKKEKIYESGYKTYKLTIAEKQRILQNNIFGVDIDSQAVEVTKLSLYLKLLENEGKEAEGQLFRFSDLTLLPDLENNIKCGNSLVGTDFYQQKLFLTEEKQIKINCFDWDKEFPIVFQNGGFDAVIGNPPYYNMQSLGAGDEQATYIQNKYSQIWQDKSDILFYFIYKALQISKSEIGYIVSNAFLFSDKARKLRNAILADGRFAKIVNFEQYQVFADASITSGIFIFNGNHQSNTVQAAVFKDKTAAVESVVEFINNDKNYISVSLKPDNVFALVDSRIAELNAKIDGNHPLLRDIFMIGKGMETAADDVFSFDKYPSWIPKRFVKQRVTGENIERYLIKPATKYILYFENINEFTDLPKSIQEHLKEHKKVLRNRATVKNEGRVWWRYSRPMHKEYYELPKLYCSRRAFRNTFVFDESFHYLGFSNMTVVFSTNKNYSIKYILALLNSRLLTFRYESIGKQTGGGSFEYFPNGVGKLPIPFLDLSKKPDKTIHDHFVTLVDKISHLKQREHAEPNPQTKKIITRQIDAVDRQIDKAVYQLYGLTEEEIRIVESE